MLLPFTNTIELLLKKRKWLWVSPIILFLIIVTSRVLLIIFKNSVIGYFASVACIILAGIVLLVNILLIINFIFDSKSRWCEDFSAFHSLGYSFGFQFLLRIFIGLFLIELFAGLFVSVSEIIPNKFFLLLPPVVLCFIFFRLLALWLGLTFVTYVPLVLFAISFFYPIYVLPNPVFILQGALMPVAGYIFIYSLLYLLVDIRFAYYTWREICISWIF